MDAKRLHAREYKNMALEDVADFFEKSHDEVREWAALGMLECTDKPGSYDLATCMYWRVGHYIWRSAYEKGANLPLNAAHKSALGWLMTPETRIDASRANDVGMYLTTLERSGIYMIEAIQALAIAVGALDALEMYPSRVLTADGKAGGMATRH